MPATATDRLAGLTTSVAVKPPCIAVTAFNIPLTGLLTVNGVALSEGDRVLVRSQTNAIDNGIYNASSSDWTRALDFDGSRDVVTGTLILVQNSAADGALYEVTTTGTIVFGTSEINIRLRDDPLIVYAQTQSEINAGVIPANPAYPPGNILRYGSNSSPGVSDMSAAFNVAVLCNSLITFPAGYQYNLTNAQIAASNITVDATGAELVSTTPPSDLNALFMVIPPSLLASGRLAGTDYPSAWKNGATPKPTDGDFNTMMHENNPVNRVKNVTFIGLNTSATITGIRAYSVDGICFRNCNLQNTTWSCVRMFHCTGIDADGSNVFGGSGTYVMFALKCGGPINITARFNSVSATRQLSFKGALHPPGLSIFSEPILNLYTDMNARVSVNISRGIDGVFFDTTPAYSSDCNSAAQGGAGTGVNAGKWYFQGQNFQLVGSTISLPDAIVSVGGEQGRGFWTSSPHQDTSCIGNKFLNATVFFSASYFSCDDNQFQCDAARGYFIVVNPQDTPTGLTCSHYSVSSNRMFNWLHVGSIVSLIQLGGADAMVQGNRAFNPDSSTQGFIGLNSLDYSTLTENVMSYTTPSPTFIVSSGNTHGAQKDNKIINASTGVARYSEFQGSSAGNVSDGGTITHNLISTPSSVIAVGTLAGTIVDVTAVSSTTFTVSLKTWTGGSLTPASAQPVYFRAKV